MKQYEILQSDNVTNNLIRSRFVQLKIQDRVDSQIYR